jgi:hypothetical protein
VLEVGGHEHAVPDLRGVVTLEDAFTAVGQSPVADAEAQAAERQVVAVVGR